MQRLGDSLGHEGGVHPVRGSEGKSEYSDDRMGTGMTYLGIIIRILSVHLKIEHLR